MPHPASLRLATSSDSPRPVRTEEVDDDEILEFTLPASVAEDIRKNLGNQDRPPPATRPLAGRLRRFLRWPW